MCFFFRMPPLSQSSRSRARALNSARRRLIKVEHRVGVVERATTSTRRRLTRVEKHVGASERLIREMRGILAGVVPGTSTTGILSYLNIMSRAAQVIRSFVHHHRTRVGN